MTLRTYNKKRNFKKTPEPRGAKQTSGSKHLYLIQKHAASHLHYDFRIELNGTLKSWAVPKGPSLDPSVKRLAIHVEDHPVSYGSFEGVIPQGQYGGGTVMLWDTGEWVPQEEQPLKAYKAGHFTFELKGKKLKGLWKLIQIKKDPKNWLLMKVQDKYARPEADYDITKKKPLGALSGATMEKIADSDNEWISNKQLSSKKTSKAKKKALASPGKKTKMPTKISPQLATLVATPPEGDEWLHEVKLDGYRLLCFIKNKKINLMTRGHQNWTHKFPHLVDVLRTLKLDSAILDGEIVALNKKQHSDFQRLQNCIHQGDDAQLVLNLFDIIYYDEKELFDVPLLERKNLLRTLFSDSDTLRYSDHVVGHGDTVFKKARELNLEGIVSKKINSPYSQTRNRNWQKVKCVKRQEFIVGGYTQPSGLRNYFGALLLGVYAGPTKLIYCGQVGTGFTQNTLIDMWKLLQKYKTNTMPFTINPPRARQTCWVKPAIIIEVEFFEWTGDGVLRHPSFKGIRLDKKIKEVTMEKPLIVKKTPKKKTIKNEKNNLLENLTHPDRIMYPEKGITKLELAEYYSAVSDWILPYVTERALSLVRCPGGREKCFYQKHMAEANRKGPLYPVKIKENNKTDTYSYIKNPAGLIQLVQLGVLEIHPWGSRIEKIEKPDILIFDLDPGPQVEWKKVINSAFFLQEQLADIGLKSFVKTTGGKGLHIVVPIQPLHKWDKVKIFTHAFVEYLVQQKPNDYIGVMTKSKRTGKIFIDYLRNQRGATAIAPYSTRARENAPVAVPLAWDELSARIKSDSFTIRNLPDRLAKLQKDPWIDFFKTKQTLPMDFKK